MGRDLIKAFSVSQVNQYIKTMFVSDYALNHISVKGEVSNCKYHGSGHIYFTLKDKKSQMACVMFAGERNGLNFLLKEGQSVIVFGSVNVYERDGKYQLYAREIHLDGIGLLYEKMEQLKIKLEEEGIFAGEYKKKIPVFSKTIGIVTADTGAVIQDIKQISKRRNPYVQLILYPAKVQGEGAKETIINGIRVLDSMDLDVIIVGRGGGSLEDLWSFNEEEVVRAIFECQTPIISAVGHETDTTLSDYAADLRAPTPSAAAELAVCDIRSVLLNLQECKAQMNRAMLVKISQKRKELDQIKLKLEYNSPKSQILQKRQLLMNIEEKISYLIEKRIQEKKHKLALYMERMKGLSPIDKLNQGYSYISDKNGQGVVSISQVEKGDILQISVTDGDILAEVMDKSGRERLKWQNQK